MNSDTIAAVSTAMSPAGIGIVRISGAEAFDIADQIYDSGTKKKKKLSEQPSHTIHYGFIVDGEEVIDEVLVMLLRGPRSYTAEDTVEINCHGGVFAVRRVLETVLKHGVRAAEPGEFTKRAFLNGRIDLSQAEAVMDVIEAQNEYALRSSVKQQKGAVQERIKALRAGILYEIAHIESALDDPEHISLEGYPEELGEKNEGWKKEVETLLRNSEDGKIMTEGIRTVILGKPNAGKSSLLNVLTGEERAIVTDIAGTTRDTLEEKVNLGGVTLLLVDTAGIRQTEDVVEKIGVKRSRESVRDADLILYVADSSTRLDENDQEIMELLKEKKAVVLLNKTDLEAVTTEESLVEKLREAGVDKTEIIPISALENKGLERLSEKVKEMFFGGELSFNDQVYITNARQKQALLEAHRSLIQVGESIEAGMPEDFFSIDLMSAYEALGRILGESLGEDLVNEIFSKFCTGK